MKPHTHKSQTTTTTTTTTSTKEASHSQAMTPNVVPPTSSSPVQQQQQQQRTYYWHASTPTNTSPAYYGPVVVEPYFWQQQQQAQSQHQEWASPPSPHTNDVYQQIEALQTQVHEWRNNAQSWQRHCDEINRAHEKETSKLKAKVNELLRQKSVLVEKVKRYKTAAASSSFNHHHKSESKQETTTPITPITKQEATGREEKPKPVSILRSPKKSCLVSPRPLKKRRVRLDDTQHHVRCISPRTVSSAPPMPVTPPMPQGKWAAL